MADFVVCIPSYKRAQICKDQTLRMLQANKIPREKIFVYVADQSEWDVYTQTLDPNSYCEIVIGLKGLAQQRQFIIEQYPEGTHIVFFDDDVLNVDLSMSDLFHDKSLADFIQSAFAECHRYGSYIWGVYPVFNPYFRKNRIEMTTCLNHIVGCFYGIINRPGFEELKLMISAENGQKEDIERSILYWLKDNITIRFNKVGFQTKYYGTTGGLGTFKERIQSGLNACKKLNELYSSLGRMIERKNGMMEFRLRKIKSGRLPVSDA